MLILNLPLAILNLPEKFQVYTYLTRAERIRYMHYVVKGGLKNGSIIHCSELAYPPFGYVLTFDSPIPHTYLNNITSFKNYNYNSTESFKMTLAQLPTYTTFPLDYRGKGKLNSDIENANVLMDKMEKYKQKKVNLKLPAANNVCN